MKSKQLKIFLKQYWILLVLIATKLILQFALINPIYELHRDEFLHLDQAFHPAAGYISVPPFTSWMSGLIYLMGGGLFWIRLVPALFGTMTVVFGWLIVEALGGKLAAKVLTSTLLIFSVYTRMNVLFQPNSFDILVWTVIFYSLIKYLERQHLKWLILLSLVTTLGLYNKYTLAFLIIGLFLGLIISGQRYIFKRKALYYAISFALLLFLPNVIWQITNHFPVLHHMHALKENQLVNINRIDFLLDQFKYGLIGIPTIAAFWAFIFYKPFQPYRFVFWTFIGVLVLFTISRAKSYYSLGLYPVLFAFGSVYLETWFGKWKTVLISFLVVTNITAFSFIIKYLMPYQQPSEIIANPESYKRLGLLRWEDGKNHPLPQDFADMLGWKEMADKALAAYQMVPSGESQSTLIYCDNYGQAGALNYFNRGQTPEAYTFNSDYIHWLPRKIKFRNMLLVGHLPRKEVIEMFEEYKRVGVVENEFSREKGTELFLFQGAKSYAAERFNQIAEERRKNFEIF
ncbi:MAG: glycosyltransferase family 39 protein [Candidatus Marinimicrobia bacterium]|nr:glycosyltransferase family 39 protein [Candidatus Neomarinimicrobiota bacterium]